MKSRRWIIGALLALKLCWYDCLSSARGEVPYRKGPTWAETLFSSLRGLVNEPTPEQWDLFARRLWRDFPLETDWLFQDVPFRRPGQPLDIPQVFRWLARSCVNGEEPAGTFDEILSKVISELPAEQKDLISTRCRELQDQDPQQLGLAMLRLYCEACRMRRQNRLRNIADICPSFVFVKHFTLGGSHYAYTEGLSNAWNERHFVPGSALCLAEWDGGQFRTIPLIEDPSGVIRDPDVSFDARNIVFAWKKSDRQDDYHLYELNLENRDLRQLTFGAGLADYEPTYLPEGDIIFNSTRCIQAVDCWWTEVSNLFRWCRKSGEIRRLTFDQVHTNFPVSTGDGRVIYTRWEYNDRGQIFVQPLMEMNADGTGQRGVYGGNSWFPTTILHARPIPGTQRLVAIATGHHTRQTGKLIVVDPGRGRDENVGITLAAPIRAASADRIDAYGQEGELFQYPYPLTDSELLVGYHPIGWGWRTARGVPFGIYWMSLDGRRELLAWDSELPCNRPIPLRRRPSFCRAMHAEPARSQAICYVYDVYAGPGLEGIPRGEAKSLRVVALDYRALAIGKNRNEGPAGAAMISTPIAIGNGSWDVKVILGEVSIEADGSACFAVPPGIPVYFQVLDGRGFAIQTMRSWVTFQPGEKVGCVGCHEHKNTAPPPFNRFALALRRAPELLQGFFGPARGFSFRRKVQPILNAKCISCHDGKQASSLLDREIVDVSAKRRWNEAYVNLTHARFEGTVHGWVGDPNHPVVNWISAQSPPPPLPPRSAGAARSQLFAILEGKEKSHPPVSLTDQERRTVAAWIDLCVPFCGDYREAHLWSPEEVAIYDRYLKRREELAK